MSDLSSISTPDLEAELERRRVLAAAQEEQDAVARIRTLNLKGITVKDVILYPFRHCDSEPVSFSFSLRHDGEDYDFYYDWFDHKKDKPLPWWPAHKEDGPRGEWVNDATQFVPPGFCEESENSYAFDGTDEQAIERLRAAGYETMMTEDDSA